MAMLRLGCGCVVSCDDTGARVLNHVCPLHEEPLAPIVLQRTYQRGYEDGVEHVKRHLAQLMTR